MGTSRQGAGVGGIVDSNFGVGVRFIQRDQQEIDGRYLSIA